jgi:hypothetical protein
MDYQEKLAKALISKVPFDRFFEIAIEMKLNNVTQQGAYSIFTSFLRIYSDIPCTAYILISYLNTQRSLILF